MATAKANRTARAKHKSGKLRIGDDWNAITIIALSQTNPLKAVAEFVENSIDARARHITITRGREKGQAYLRILDDGDGIPKDGAGAPNFKYVATHICDSIKRQMKSEGAKGIQGEFGIGLLSFWTVGEELTLTATGRDGKTHQMHMRKGDPSYTVRRTRALFPASGTELKVAPLLPGIRQFSGEKIQWYLASELRDRIRRSGVSIQIIDRQARKEYTVEPRQFGGRLLHQLPVPKTAFGDVYVELYLTEPGPDNQVGVYRSGTRVLADIMEMPTFQHEPWNSGFLQGIIDAPFLNLTPGTRTGIIQDAAYESLCRGLVDLEVALQRVIDEQQRAEEERASRQVLRTIQKAFKEALLALPAEEYDWFDIQKSGDRNARGEDGRIDGAPIADVDTDEGRAESILRKVPQKQFFEYAGPLYSVLVSPQSSVVPVGQGRTYRAIARDRSKHVVEHDLKFEWEIIEGDGALDNVHSEIVNFTAPALPGLTQLQVTVTQGTTVCVGQGVITITDSLLPEMRAPSAAQRGLPGYTFKHAPGELWRSRFDVEQNVIVVNNGHRDFVYASRNKALKLRYICRLFAKELIYKNFPGYPPDELLERMIELSLYTEENLR